MEEDRPTERRDAKPPEPAEPLDDKLRTAILDAAELLVVVLDREGKVRRFNAACEKATGFRAEEVLGHSVWQLVPEDEHRRVQPVFERLRDEGHPDLHENDWLTLRGTRRRIAWSNTTVRDEAGRVAYVIGTGIDVTELRRAEEAHRGSESRLVGILESAMDAIISVDEAQQVVLFNPAAVKMFGRERDEVIGKPLDLLIPERFRGDHREHVRRFGSTGTSSRRMGKLGQVWGLRANGDEFPVEASISRTETDGKPLLTVILRDASERERAAHLEKQLRQAEELASLGTLVAGLAHDIGTPLNVVLGYAELLGRSVEKENDRERVEKIREQVKRVSDLMRSLLNIARPQESVRAPVEIEPLLEQTLHFLEEKLRRRGIAVKRDFRGAGEIRGDRERFERAFLNLFLNAADAMPRGGELRVQTRPLEGDRVEIRIADTGTGIPPGHLERIFEPFYTTKPPGQGSGLGLLVARGAVVDHGGSIDVKSELDVGTEVRIGLPRDGETPRPTR